MIRAQTLLASCLVLMAIGTPGFGDTVEPKIEPDLRASISTPLALDDPRQAERVDHRLHEFFALPSVGQAEPVDRRIQVAQAKLPSLKEVNLLAADQGGQALVVPTDEWFKPISGNEGDYATVDVGQEAVYAFKDEKPGVFSKFSVLITGQAPTNPSQIEVLVADDSPTGVFRSVGKLNTVNAKIVKSPYQEVSFGETTAKYIKIKILANHGAYNVSLGQIRLLGRPVE